VFGGSMGYIKNKILVEVALRRGFADWRRIVSKRD